ncbi:hypothetical protein MYX65_07730 [Acidobacteria bacterium AH-259-L09]|nr:hypothetical protein [Acidobacteria bacterium AH-259-L09]
MGELGAMGKKTFLAAITAGLFTLTAFWFNGSVRLMSGSSVSPGAQAAQGSSGNLAFDTTSLPLLVKLTFGLSDSEPMEWNGIAHLDKGEFLDLQGWVFTGSENVHSLTTSWTVNSKVANFNTRREPAGEPPLGGRRRLPYGPSPTRPVGVWLKIQAPSDAVLTVNTTQGSFEIRLGEIPDRDPLEVLNGRALVERAVDVFAVTQTSAQEDYPSVAAGRDGRLYAAWIGYQNDSDTVFYSVLERSGWSTPRKVTEKKGIYGSTSTVSDGEGRVWVIYNQLESGQFDLWAGQIAPALKAPVQLTSHPGNDINFGAVTDKQGKIWLVWQSLRDGNSDIFAMRGSGFDSRLEEMRVSEHSANDWDPAVAVDSVGNAVVIWDTYRNGDYDIYMRAVDSQGRLGDVVPVAATPHYEVHASAVFDTQDRLWVAWEESGPNWGKDTGQESTQVGTMLHTYRELRLRCRQNGNWFELEEGPQSRFEGLPLNFQEQPQLLLDEGGRLWLLFRQWISRQNPPEVWNIYAMNFNGRTWLGPIQLPHSDGRLKQDFPAVALPDGRIWVVYSTDFRGTGTDRNRQWDVYCASLTAQGTVEATNKFTEVEVAGPSTRYQLTPNQGYETQVGNQKYYLFYGDLHRHTDIRGHGGTDISIPDQYRYALDAAELDFMATTDHNQVSGDAWADGVEEYGWWRTQKNADLYYFPGRFVSLYAYERSFVTPGGHRNIVWPNRGGELITGDRRIPAENIPLGLWRRLKRTAGISIPHTPADKNQPHVGWDWHDPESQPVMEMYQAARSSYEYAGAPPDESRGHTAMEEEGYFLWDALRRGHRIGVIASSDHGSTHLSYAAVYATDFSREAIFEGLKSRRTFAATDNIIIDFRIDDAFIGEDIALSEPPKLEIKARGTGLIRQIDIAKDNHFIYTTHPGKADAEVVFSDQDSQPGTTSYYYVRVIQEDEMMAWSSPIWVTRR